VKAQQAIAIFRGLISEFDRKEELQRAFQVFQARAIEAEEREENLFIQAAKFVSFSHYDFDSDILALDDLIEELEDRKLL
jgi:hypothetical protein